MDGGLDNNQKARKMCPVMTATALSNDAGSQHVYTWRKLGLFLPYNLVFSLLTTVYISIESKENNLTSSRFSSNRISDVP